LDNNLIIKQVTVLITNRCNFKCEHCFWGNLEKEETITKTKLKYVVQKCVENNIKHICFSGGEPVLYLDEIVEIMKLYKQKFSVISICTNGYWGNDINIFKSLHIAGINNIELSYDEYHSKFVGFEKINNIITEAKKIGIGVQCVVSVANDKSIVNFQRKLMNCIDTKNITYQYVGHYGNGKNIMVDDRKRDNTKCLQFMNQICIDFKGLLYYCCGPYIAFGEKTNFCVGKFNQTNINTLIKNKKLFEYMNYREYSDGVYMCEECLKRLDNYILSKRICSCTKIKRRSSL